MWSQQELCGRRPAKIDPFEWACQGRNVDSFLLFTRLKRLPKVPTFAQAVVQQRRVTEEEAKEAKWRQNAAARTENVESGAQVSAHMNCVQIQLETTCGATRSDGVVLELHTSHLASGPDEPEGQVAEGAGSLSAGNGVRSFSLFDDEEGEIWQQ